MIEDRGDSSPPFYTSLNIHDKVLHNCLMDSGESHNLMPKTVMEELGLEIKKSYHDMYSFDSRKVQCLGVIKDLVVTLFQMPMKSVVMDIVVADVPPKFGMLLSRSWIKRLGGTLQMDLTYDTILVFGGEHKRLYKEDQLAYIISDESDPTNHPIFSLDTELGSSLLQFTDAPKPPLKIKKHPMVFHKVYLSPPPLFEKCSLMEPPLRMLLVLEWYLFHPLKRPYLYPTNWNLKLPIMWQSMKLLFWA
jgi:hypothetical protein